MTYEQIETFLTIITYGTISSAAKHLFVSQSTVSSRIQLLEEELGVPLLVRHRGQRTVDLTSYGTAFIPVASQWASLWKDTQQIKLQGKILTLRIASVDAVNNYTFVSLFQSHIAKYPDIRLSVNTHHSNEIYGLVQSRAADIGFVFSRINYPDIVVRPVYRELMYLVCSKDSPYSEKMECKELDPRREIYLNWGQDYQGWHDLHWRPAEYPLLTVNTGSMLQRYLNLSGCWTIAPMSVVYGAIRSNPNLTYYALKDPPPPRICYEIRNLYPIVSHEEPIRLFEEELNQFVDSDDNICRFEPWMIQPV